MGDALGDELVPDFPRLDAYVDGGPVLPDSLDAPCRAVQQQTVIVAGEEQVAASPDVQEFCRAACGEYLGEVAGVVVFQHEVGIDINAESVVGAQ